MQETRTTGVIFNIQQFSVHDGPGIRTTVFLKGCPLRCRWCHNPEGSDPLAVVSVLPERCIGCESCCDVCPQGVAERLDQRLSNGESAGRCVRCGACAEACPSGARTLVGHPYTPAELLQVLERDRVFYDESGGGITFSGGEPLAPGNIEFLKACLTISGRADLHRTVDTTGFASKESLREVAQLTDLFLYDLKLMDDRQHREYVGVSNQLILENLRSLSDLGSEIWIRVPIIPGITDSRDNLTALAEFVSSLKQRHPVCLLPYHKIGADKYRRLRESSRMDSVESPSQESISATADLLRESGLTVRIGG